ncbi:hypothetical protein I203_102297 [Kwoniella mangroviensis CBS 8507]|uniref:uncharacterized protein n=1 Tax=Kwoniella mangroviensis CBS 8507 TaxID=1296122 RepID=UPI00302FA3D7
MYSAYLAPVGVFTFLTLTQQVVADNLFSGCYKNDGSTFTVQQEDAPSSSLECSTFCGNDGYAYSAWKDDEFLCYCSNNYPQEYYLLSGSDAACESPSDLNVRVTQTSFMSTGCVDSVTYAEDGWNDFLVLNPEDCFRNCNGAYGATYIANSQNGHYTCHCHYFLFYHSQAAQASGLTRRRARDLRELQARRFKREIEYCPYGLTACNVDGHSGNYECLDTNTELQSCGGCFYGQYSNHTSVVGEDCTTTGAALGASSCIHGKCVASACKKGLALVGGKCQKK